jgi:anti-sigma factor RsiW
MSCPDVSVLQAYVEGFASAEERVAMRAHLEECSSCRELVLALAPELPAAKRPPRVRARRKRL